MYNFDKLTNRFNTNSIKWDVKTDELPMWVADMDFEVAPCIVDAINKRVSNRIFGYSDFNDEWRMSYINFWKRRHGLEIKLDEIMYVTGVVPAISSIVRKLTAPAEKVLIQTPVYNIFFNSIVNNGRYVIESPLVYENGEYSIDFEDLENKMADPQTTLMILCNPHNPVGKIWTKEELSKIGTLARMHGVTVVSDEIHCDIVAPNKSYVPYLASSQENHDTGIQLIAPTKCFNIAGLHTAAIVIPNKFLYHRVNRQINTDEVAEPNSFAVEACIAALNEGEAWLDEMREYVFLNRSIVEEFVSKNLNDYVSVVKGDATYLVWIDCSRITDDSKAFTSFLRENTGLFVSNGSQYGNCGKAFIRLNVACPRTRLFDGLDRFMRGVKLFLERK